MPANSKQKARTRARIVDAAARQFRRHGYAGTGIDSIMAEAGLTRGGFYAHFDSKAELFTEVVASRHDLIDRLRGRDDADPAGLQAAAAEILQAYLSPANLPAVAPNCGFATLAADAARAAEPTRHAFSAQIDAFWQELFRGRRTPPDARETETALRVLALAVGALTLASASDNQPLAEALLSAAQGQVADWLAELAARP